MVVRDLPCCVPRERRGSRRRAARPRAGAPTAPRRSPASRGIRRSLSATKSSRTSSPSSAACRRAYAFEPRTPVPKKSASSVASSPSNSTKRSSAARPSARLALLQHARELHHRRRAARAVVGADEARQLLRVVVRGDHDRLALARQIGRRCCAARRGRLEAPARQPARAAAPRAAATASSPPGAARARPGGAARRTRGGRRSGRPSGAADAWRPGSSDAAGAARPAHAERGQHDAQRAPVSIVRGHRLEQVREALAGRLAAGRDVLGRHAVRRRLVAAQDLAAPRSGGGPRRAPS